MMRNNFLSKQPTCRLSPVPERATAETHKPGGTPKMRPCAQTSSQRDAQKAARTAANLRSCALIFLLGAMLAVPAYAQSDPWSRAVTLLSQIFSSTIARGLAIVCVVIGGIEVAIGEGHSKKLIGGLVFGLGMALGAVSFITWLFA